ncbi:MAG TPA: hypothetical protein VHK63_00975 [Candidatus Limnocylindria bacterium]|nr:hypothetical protein [Candidatus Limnocylindria bacterium]
MNDRTDSAATARALARALPLLARDSVACALAAATLPGPEGIALRRPLRRMARDELTALEGIAARVATLDALPEVRPSNVKLPNGWKAAVRALVTMQRETLEALVAAIPADADDVEGEATEHLLEHAIARKRDALELLERALR